MARYRVFHRTWWRRNPSWPQGLEPCAGRKTTIGYADNEASARSMCKVWCYNHEPGALSRKAEYMEV